MKAVRFSQFGGPEVLQIVDLPDPHPGPGQVRIAVRAAGVNPSDWKKRKGLMDGELPQTMGHEAAGVVDELGEGVADVAVGDRVFGFSAEGRRREPEYGGSRSWLPAVLPLPDEAVPGAARLVRASTRTSPGRPTDPGGPGRADLSRAWSPDPRPASDPGPSDGLGTVCWQAHDPLST